MKDIFFLSAACPFPVFAKPWMAGNLCPAALVIDGKIHGRRNGDGQADDTFSETHVVVNQTMLDLNITNRANKSKDQGAWDCISMALC